MDEASMIFLSEEQERVVVAIRRGDNILITGSAGTGKSTLLRFLKDEYGTNEMPVCASTGIAAVNVGGVTVHSWAGLGMGRDSAESIAKMHMELRGRVYKRIKKAKRLAIDEVSMIHGELFNLLSDVMKIIRDDQRPFGGVQIIAFGDFLQLPPVSRDQDSQQFAFQSRAWVEANMQTALLTRVFRQEDAVFSEALNNIRVGNLTPEVVALLKSRLKVEDPDPEVEPVTVYTHNEDVDRMNAERLSALPGEEKQWKASDWGEPGPLATLQKNCLAPETLRLRVGAQVMLLWNVDTGSGLANGSIGTVTGWGKFTKLPVVKFRQGQEREIEKRSWEIKLGGDVLASRDQVPLRLAWAITAHKSQGMTLDKIKVHLDRAFEYGQSYVALSRSRTLAGLYIGSSAPGCIKAHPAAVKFYEECKRI